MRSARARRRLALAAALVAFASAPLPVARAQPTSDLAAARSLFAAGLADESHGDYAAALAKFERVRAVKDTQAVRYRIATCLEGLGRLREAINAYTAAAIDATSNPESARIAKASRDAVAGLEKRLAAGEGASATPGPTPSASASAPASAPAPASASASASASPPAPASAPAAPPVASLVLFASSAVLAAGTVVVLVLRHSDIASIESTCPNGVCPTSRESDVTSTRDRALVEGPIAIGMGAAAVVTAGIRAYLLVASKPAASGAAVAPWVDRRACGVGVAGRF